MGNYLGQSKGDNRPYSRCQILKPCLVFLNRASYGRRRNNDVTSQEREVTMMLRHNLRTDAQICGKSATQASLFVRHGRGVNRVYKQRIHSFSTNECNENNINYIYVLQNTHKEKCLFATISYLSIVYSIQCMQSKGRHLYSISYQPQSWGLHRGVLWGWPECWGRLK